MDTLALTRMASRPAGLGTTGVPSHTARMQGHITTRLPGRAVPSHFRGMNSKRQKDGMHSVARAGRSAGPVEDPEVDRPFLEPFVRSMILGLGTAVLLETAHFSLEAYGLAESAGMSALAQALLTAQDSFVPLGPAADHVAALTSWVGFYIIEAVAIGAVLQTYAGDKAAASSAIQNMVTLPKRMLPVRLQLFKYLAGVGRPAAATATAGVPAASTTAPAAVQLQQATAAPASTVAPARQEVSTPDAFEFVDSSSSSATLERRQYPSTLPLPIPARQPQQQKPRQQVTRLPGEPTREGQLGTAGSNIVPLPMPVQPPTVSGDTLTERPSRKGLKPGEWDPAAAGFARRQQELVGRRSYLKNFWYAAALSQNVKQGEPHGVTLFGKEFVLFREQDSTVRCMDSVCAHRGAPLSEGWVSCINGHDCVVCPYHGWAFDSTGTLQDVPAAENRESLPKRPILATFPVEEKGGFIWMFYSSKDLPAEERPPIPFVPELEDPSWKAVYDEVTFDCNHFTVFENALDMAHIHYVHDDSFGNQGMPQIRDMRTVADAYSVTATFKLNNKPVNALWEWSKVPEVRVSARAYLPSSACIQFTLGNGLSFTTFINTVPVSANKTVNRFCLVRNLEWDKTGVFNARAWDDWARKAMLRIMLEDKEIVEKLRPDLLPQEYNVRADLPQLAFRKLRQQYINLGYAEVNEEDASRAAAAQQQMPDF